MRARLTEFGQHPPTGLGMHKGDLRFMSAHARSLVDQANTFSFELCQALLQIGDFVGHVMYSGTILLQELYNWRIRRRWLPTVRGGLP